MNQNLREKQKASRHARILEVARSRFQKDGYWKVTIEDVARDSELSPATVYNYFGSKPGILLALVGESDIILLAEVDALFAAHQGGLVEAVLAFGRTLRSHAISFLQKPTWREVLSTSIQEGSSEFGQTYQALDKVLIGKLATLIATLQDRGEVPATIDAAALADCLFALQNIRFFQFISDDHVTLEAADALLGRDLRQMELLFGRTEVKAPPSAGG